MRRIVGVAAVAAATLGLVAAEAAASPSFGWPVKVTPDFGYEPAVYTNVFRNSFATAHKENFQLAIAPTPIRRRSRAASRGRGSPAMTATRSATPQG